MSSVSAVKGGNYQLLVLAEKNPYGASLLLTRWAVVREGSLWPEGRRFNPQDWQDESAPLSLQPQRCPWAGSLTPATPAAQCECVTVWRCESDQGVPAEHLWINKAGKQTSSPHALEERKHSSDVNEAVSSVTQHSLSRLHLNIMW